MLCTYIHINLYIYICVCVYVCMCVYYVYIYIHISQYFFRVFQKCPFLVSFFIGYYGYCFIKFVNSIETK